MLKKIIVISFSIFSINVYAEQNIDRSTNTRVLNLGIGLVGSTGLYVGEDTEVMAIPVIAYEGEKFFIRGLYGGSKFYKNNNLTLNAIVSANMMNLDVHDLSSSKLQKIKLDKSQLVDRDRSVDVGFESIIKLPSGILSVQAIQDIGDASNAAEVKVNYQYFWNFSNQLSLVPNIGLDWLSNSRANYYYGVLDKEVNKGVKFYKPNSLLIPHISLGSSYIFDKNWRVTGVLMQKFLPTKIKDSPIIDAGSATNFLITFSYSF